MVISVWGSIWDIIWISIWGYPCGSPWDWEYDFPLWGSPYGYPYGDIHMEIHMGISIWGSTCGSPWGFPQKSCGNGMGMGMEIPFPRQACQILESQRRLNLSNILKLFLLQQCKSELTLRQFINTFSSTADEPIHTSYDQYIEVIHELDSIDLDIQVLQSIVFIGGYAVFSYLKTTNCNNCVLKLTENKDIEISETT